MTTNTQIAAFDTLGFDTEAPWSLNALRLVYSCPRTYSPLVMAAQGRNPNIKPGITRLLNLGFLTYQEPVIINTLTGDVAAMATRSVPRYVVTKKGRRFFEQIKTDRQVLFDKYPRVLPSSASAVVALLHSFCLERTAAEHGLSVAAARSTSSMGAPSVKWWVGRWVDDGFLKVLDKKLADTRELIPAHYRPTKKLTNHLLKIGMAFPSAALLKDQLRLTSWRPLLNINPQRVGITGTTDYDHDIICQETVALLITSESFLLLAPWKMEQSSNLYVKTTKRPWEFTEDATERTVVYQPDVIYREKGQDGRINLCALEYERAQTRRDGWSHIEKFLGYLHCHTLPNQTAILRFVVNSRKRENTYVELLQAFADYLLDNPLDRPANEIILAVSSIPRLKAATDPLDNRNWNRIRLSHLPSGSIAKPVLHEKEHSPYGYYFSR